MPHPDFGEAVVAVCVAAVRPAPEQEPLLQKISGQLAAFKRPKVVVFVDELPRNAIGKVQKNNLRENYQQLFNNN